ncbi:hypothetical protein [Lysobacter sp. CA199]|uniref:hypothetical protein n=1 Tax=Lysobacter sp. CA199 TaxID=3455608 RepID=UPI003F8D4D01
MKVTFELWHLLTLAITVITAFMALGRMLLAEFDRRFTERLMVLSEDAAGWRDQERELLRFKAEIAEKFVRREDYIRGQTVIESKLDAISSEVKLVQIQGAQR